MSRVPVADMPAYIRAREPFTGSSLRARYEGAVYQIWHLNNLLATVDRDRVWLAEEHGASKRAAEYLRLISNTLFGRDGDPT